MVKIAFGSIGDSFNVGSLKSYLAEFIATLLFVFAGVGSAIAYGNSFFLSRLSTELRLVFNFGDCLYVGCR